MSERTAVQSQAAVKPAPAPVASGFLQRAAITSSPVNEVPPIVHDVLRSPGQPLDAVTRALMEPRFGHDFSDVRVHTDAKAAESARVVNSLAYTVGGHIVFGYGKYTPNTLTGRQLAAHELAHVVQQSRGGGRAGPAETSHLESAANMAATEVTSGPSGRVAVAGAAAPRIMRQPMDPRHARGHAGEQGMGFGYSQEKDWILVEGPSGAAGHGVTTKGFDGVAYNIKADELHLIDNKSLKGQTVYSATAITKNLQNNLGSLINRVEGMKDMPNQPRILQLLKQMESAVASGTKIPSNTKLIVTGEGGQAQVLGGVLSKTGVEFRESGTTDLALAKAQQKTPPTASTPPTTAAAKTPPPTTTATETPPPTATTAPPKPTPVVESSTSPVVAPPVRPKSAWKAGLKAGGKAVVVALIFAGLAYLVHRQLEKELEESIDKARHGAMPWAQRLKRENPWDPVYIRVTIRSEDYSRYVPLLGWMPETPKLHMIQIAMVREEIDPPVVEVQDDRLDVWRPGVATTVTYTELMVP